MNSKPWPAWATDALHSISKAHTIDARQRDVDEANRRWLDYIETFKR